MNRRMGDHTSEEIFKCEEIMMCFLANCSFCETCHYLNIKISGSVHGINLKFSGNTLQYLKQDLNQNYTQKIIFPCFFEKSNNRFFF